MIRKVHYANRIKIRARRNAWMGRKVEISKCIVGLDPVRYRLIWGMMRIWSMMGRINIASIWYLGNMQCRNRFLALLLIVILIASLKGKIRPYSLMGRRARVRPILCLVISNKPKGMDWFLGLWRWSLLLNQRRTVLLVRYWRYTMRNW
jgi:hypothetical protein